LIASFKNGNFPNIIMKTFFQALSAEVLCEIKVGIIYAKPSVCAGKSTLALGASKIINLLRKQQIAEQERFEKNDSTKPFPAISFKHIFSYLNFPGWQNFPPHHFMD
jgi:hypothetical protein